MTLWLVYLNCLPISTSWCKKVYALHYIPLLKPHKHWAAWEKSKFESIQLFSLDFYLFTLLIFLSICKWQLNEHFLFTTIIKFCLIYSLHFLHDNQNPSVFPVERSSIHLFKIHILAAFRYNKLFWHFLSFDFTNATTDGNT